MRYYIRQILFYWNYTAKKLYKTTIHLYTLHIELLKIKHLTICYYLIVSQTSDFAHIYDN